MLDEAFAALESGEVSRRGYVAAVDGLVAGFPPEVASAFRFRRDGRSVGLLALKLWDNTRRERFLLERCWPQIARVGDTFRDLGLANDGRLVVVARRGPRVEADFMVENDVLGDYPIDVKFGPTQRFLTYKTFDLANALRTPRARILTVAMPDRMSGPNGDPDDETPFSLPPGSFFLVMDHEAVSRVIDLGEHGRHSGFGGKETVKIRRKLFTEIATIHPLENADAR